MINIENENVKKVLDEIHEGLNRKAKRMGRYDDENILENRILAIIHDDNDAAPAKCAELMNSKYGCNLSGNDVIGVFRRLKIANPVERKEIFIWADNLSRLFAKSLDGDTAAFKEFDDTRKKPALKTGRWPFVQNRIAVLSIYKNYPELNTDGDWEKFERLGNVLAKYFFYDMCDAVAATYGYPITYNEGRGKKHTNIEKNMTKEEAINKLKYLDGVLDRTNSMLSELQSEFDQQIEEAKTKELAEFFSQLNSEKYGCILDELFSVRRGMGRLRSSEYELPVEINGLLIMVKKLIQFVRDSHIEPILKMNDVKMVKASDIEFCSYDGTPFAGKNAEKQVRVVSPGWIIKDKEVLISRPKLKEERR